MRGALLAAVLIASAGCAAASQITAARYDGPTTRYAHGVLGDAVEYEDLVVTLSDGRVVTAHWDAPMVFEDTAPRLADVDGDGAPEVITVETHAERGARLAIWHWDGTALRHRATGDFIGQTNRWLAPAGVADLDGDGRVEIAYVDRPHLAKTLRLFNLVGNDLSEVARAEGLSNHRIGWDYIIGGAAPCASPPALILARGDWSETVAVTWNGDRIVTTAIGPWSPSRAEAARTCR
ncbi:FG-GAP repeat protein [Roseivivax sp. THAF40]|uniref:FG-GAP repeat domain-containing protein n=1 Tax=unclassified Roseivivax TaxID=2639302 RepID=UPI001268DAD5|nr:MULTISPECIES: VCBS repeat-containing protein [unclassified Roseivivax]QFS82058.1 FG-GAP repeat protein [Roseivivax sp. THAF197b]QFT45858.1 FG-GAP repeat protein [Roseivivax sp. THAF40]